MDAVGKTFDTGLDNPLPSDGTPPTRALKRGSPVGARSGPYREGASGAVEKSQTESDSQTTVRRREWIFRRAIIGSDMLAAALAVYVAVDFGASDRLRPGYLLVLPLIALVAKVQGLYDRDDLVIRKSTLDELPRLVNLATLVAMLVWLSRHVIVIGAPSTWTLLKIWLMLIAAIVLGRIAARRLASRIAPRERCYFVGDDRTAAQLRTRLGHTAGADLVGSVTPEQIELDEEGIRALARRFDVHRIIISAASGLPEERTIELVRAAKATGMRVTISPGVLAVVGSAVVFEDVGGLPLLGVPRFGLSRSSAALKRGFDVLGAAAGIVAVSPLLAAIAALIRLDAPGPVLFRQLRIGRGGEAFQIIKFRTMVAGAEEMKAELRAQNAADGLFKIDDDPRVTKVGRWLRKMSLDELPQLFNVLRGEMSLVGPRPLVLDEDEMIRGYDRRRLMITPGMTGPWQILGPSRIPLREMVKLDYVYVAHWSLWNDIKILLRTVSVVVARRGR